MYPLLSQPKPPNFDKDKYAYAAMVVSFIIALCLGMIFSSCNPVKIAARKDAIALERVKGSRTLIDKIAPIVNSLYPCANDTVFKHIKDTSFSHDTSVVLIKSTDTINKIRIDTLLKRITVTKVIHDTAFITDKQGRLIDAKTIEMQGLTIAGLNQNVIDLNTTISERNKKITWLVVACILGGIVILGLVYLVFKPSLKV